MYTTLHAIHPSHFRTLDTTALRENFLLNKIFLRDEVSITYTHYDRLIIGGAQPETTRLLLPAIDALKADYFLQRRELGIINVGKTGSITVDGERYTLENKEALYIGRGAKEIIFEPATGALFYFNSAPAHCTYPTRKISLSEAETVEIGSAETSNHRIIRKLLVNSVLETCQLQMGLTELQRGSVWNTMPPHTHDRRMEAYFYFDIPNDQAVCHFMGEAQETRHLWIKNNEGALSPPWSVHSGAGTSNYSFIWGMAGENLDYGDMDVVKPTAIR
jgi:4-deoxy-L-threo-5-hexosulose-uronate ketol-isomerase